MLRDIANNALAPSIFLYICCVLVTCDNALSSRRGRRPVFAKLWLRRDGIGSLRVLLVSTVLSRCSDGRRLGRVTSVFDLYVESW